MTNTTITGREKTSILVVATLTNFIIPFLVSSISVALPRMTVHFHMEAVAMTWVNTLYFLVLAMVQVPMGRLADIYGRKKIFLTGMVVSVVAAVGGGLAPSVPLLLVTRVLQGIGTGMAGNTIIALLTSVFPAETRGRALGIAMAGTYGGLIFGSLIGGILTDLYGWQSIFFFSAVLSTLALALSLFTLKGEWAGSKGEKFDVSGTALFAVSIALFMYGFSSLLTIVGIVCLVVGIGGFVWLIRKELRTASPVLDFRLFKDNHVFLFSNLATLDNYLATYALTFLLSLYLQFIQGFSPEKAGLIMIASTVPMMVFAPIAGRVSDKLEPRLVASAGLLLNSIALVLFIFLNNDSRLWYIILALVVYGTGIGLFSSPNTNAIMGSVDKKVLGAVSGTVGTMRNIGMMLSLGIMMVLFSAFIGSAEITPPFYPQFLTSARVGFAIFAGLCLMGVFSQFAARKKA
ncbi:MAG TPA: MFS transporter [Dehalococcoidales bacterium]|nr:MFS transporter [Dehalococcoidales bacterium]